MSGGHHDDGYEFEKEIDIEVEAEIDFDVDVEFDKDVDINVDVCADIDIDGNFASLVADVEAVGKDTLVEVDTAVLAVEDQLSSVTVVATAAVA